MSYSTVSIIQDRIKAGPIIVYRGARQDGRVSTHKYNAVFAGTVKTQIDRAERPEQFFGVFFGENGAKDFMTLVIEQHERRNPAPTPASIAAEWSKYD